MHTTLNISRMYCAMKIYLRSEEHTSELQSQSNLVCRLLLEKKTSELQSQSNLVCRLLLEKKNHHTDAYLVTEHRLTLQFTVYNFTSLLSTTPFCRYDRGTST